MLLCEPEGIQTLDLQNRNLTLYSAKLRVLILRFADAKVITFFEPCKFLAIFLCLNCKIISNFASCKKIRSYS